MTTSVKVTAHCSSDEQVRISRSGPGIDTVDTVIHDGQTEEQFVYDGLSISVKEELKTV